MNHTTKYVAALVTSGALLLSSCAEMAQNPGMAAVTGAAAGGLVGNLIGQSTHSNSGRVAGTLIGAGLGALIAVSIAHHYQATHEQQIWAERRVSESARAKARQRGCRYVAVKVPPKKGERGRQHIVKVNTATGKADDQVIVPNSASGASRGDVVNLGGQKTYLNESLSAGI